jgi:hypothetical protein
MPKYHFDVVHEDAEGISCSDHADARRKADAIAKKIAKTVPDSEPRAILLSDDTGAAVYKAPIKPSRD